MMLDLVTPPDSVGRDIGRWKARRNRLDGSIEMISLLPGPVEVAEPVANAFRLRPVSHRGPEFVATFERVRTRLTELVGGLEVGIFAGGGTLANDMVLATLAADPGVGRGLILVNGEFGERLVNQARRAGLAFDAITWPWGVPWDINAVEDRLDRSPSTRWVHGVHLETSTGMLNDLPGLISRVRRREVHVCADVVSSLGAVEVDLSEVYLAASSSGKALGSFAGLALVFAGPGALDGLATDRVPACLDLNQAIRSRTSGPGTTIGSPGVVALDRALDPFARAVDRSIAFQKAADLGCRMRRGLVNLGLPPLVAERWSSPVVFTFALPEGWTGTAFSNACRAIGFEVATASPYLQARGWAQVATMGAVSVAHVDAFLTRLGRRLRRIDARG